MSVVAIVGAGIVGASTAWELARRGADVLLLDRGEVSGATTGLGEGNVLTSDKDAGPELELTKLGLDVYDDIEALLGDEARIRRKGALVVHPDADTWAAEPARVERLRAAGVDARLVDPGELAVLEPRLGGVLGATHVAADLQCDPRAIARALARRAAGLGATVRTGAQVASITVTAGRVTGILVTPSRGLHFGEQSAEREPTPVGDVEVVQEVVRADAVVLAAGPWSAQLAASAGLALPVEPRKGQLARLALPEPDEGFLRHKIVDGGYLLSVSSADTARQVTTVTETTWDGAVLVGSSRERCGFDPAVDMDLAAAMRDRAARIVPDLADLEIDAAWVGFRPWLPDHLPAIGASRIVPGLWVATGHEGAGVALGPITGRIVAGAICGEPAPLDLSPFDPDRFI